MNVFDHKDLGNHLLQLCPKVVKHPVYRPRHCTRNVNITQLNEDTWRFLTLLSNGRFLTTNWSFFLHTAYYHSFSWEVESTYNWHWHTSALSFCPFAIVLFLPLRTLSSTEPYQVQILSASKKKKCYCMWRQVQVLFLRHILSSLWAPVDGEHLRVYTYARARLCVCVCVCVLCCEAGPLSVFVSVPTRCVLFRTGESLLVWILSSHF